MISGIVSALFWVLARICDIVLYPFTLLIKNFLPDIATYITFLEKFLDDYIFDIVKFIKVAFTNLTGFPQLIWDFVLLWISSTLIISGSIPVYRAIIAILNKFNVKD